MKTIKTIKHFSILSLAVFMAFNLTYNYYIVNSVQILDGKELIFIKRLDELDKDYNRGRFQLNLAAFFGYDKKEIIDSQPQSIQKNSKKRLNARAKFASQSGDSNKNFQSNTAKIPGSGAAIKDDLYLEIAEFQNPKFFQATLGPEQISGNLVTANGIIDSLEVSLPNGEALNISASEMKGNVFSYDHDGGVYSGMLYEVQGQGYMITLTNGPFQGSRMKFMKDVSSYQVPVNPVPTNQNIVANNTQIPQRVPLKMGNRNPSDNNIEYDNYQNPTDSRYIANDYEEQYQDHYQQDYLDQNQDYQQNYDQQYPQNNMGYQFGQ